MIRKDITFGKDQPHILLKLLTWVKTFTPDSIFFGLVGGFIVGLSVTLWPIFGYTTNKDRNINRKEI